MTLEQVDESKENTKQRFIVRDLYFEIGRDSNCEMVLPASMDHISHRQISITIRGENAYLNHLGTNPSYLNGEIIYGNTEAHDGDILQLTSEGPQYQINISEVKELSPIVRFFESKKVYWFYLALAIWAIFSILYFVL